MEQGLNPAFTLGQKEMPLCADCGKNAKLSDPYKKMNERLGEGEVEQQSTCLACSGQVPPARRTEVGAAIALAVSSLGQDFSVEHK